MTTQITLIGLNQIGTSIGLALAKEKGRLFRVGSERDPEKWKRAERLGAVDKHLINLPSAVEKADVVILDLPVDEIRETLGIITADLKPGVVVVNTAPSVAGVMALADELLPKDRYFVSLTPTTNPAYLEERAGYSAEPHADLFERSVIQITSRPGTHESAINLAADLVNLLGATPMFADAAEVDGLTAAVQLLPQLAAAALINVTVDQPGWLDTRKVAAHDFMWATEPVLHLPEAKALGQTVLNNRENSSRLLGNLIQILQEMRQEIDQQDAEALQQRLETAVKGRETWWAQRLAANWDAVPAQDMPTSGQVLGHLIGLRPKDKNAQKRP